MFQRILLAIDGSESGPVVLSFAVALAAPSSRIQVVHVNPYQFGGRGLTRETRDEAYRLVHDAISELLAAGLRATGVMCTTTCFGVPYQIAAESATWGADAIVLGSRRRRGLRRLSGQGVRQRVTRLTTLPVLTAPAPLTVTRRPGREALPDHARHGRTITTR